MKHKKTLLALAAAVPVLGLSFLGTGIASAHGFGFGGFGMNIAPEEVATRQTEMFQNQANLLGLSVDVVKTGWAEGKTLFEIATANGITEAQLQEKFKAQRSAQLKSQLQTLVSKGVITQAQADKRLQLMETRAAGKNGKGLHRGFGFF